MTGENTIATAQAAPPQHGRCLTLRALLPTTRNRVDLADTISALPLPLLP